MASTTSVKVQKSKLIDRIKEVRAEKEAALADEYASEQAAYEKWLEKVDQSFAKLVTQYQAGKLDLSKATWDDYHGGRHVTVVQVASFDTVDKPKLRKFNSSEFDSDIKLLELADDDVIVVTTTNRWSKYL